MTLFEWVKSIGSVVGALAVIAAFVWGALRIIVRGINKGFALGVDVHVKPLVKEVTDSINGVTESVRNVQAEHRLTTQAQTLTLAAHTATLSDHETQLRKHSIDIATVQGIVETLADAP